MYQAFEATIDATGKVHLSESIQLPGERRALVIVLDDPPIENEAYLLSEVSLAADWNRPEEDAAWAHLQSEK
ncbi:MAG TPA: hypothetical protein VGI40_01810 [Pirellulaceae bacterium]|jgi:hypothetical protein